MHKTERTTEADLVFNRISVQLAQSQKLLQSMLGPRFTNGHNDDCPVKEVDSEDNEVFTAEPELCVFALEPVYTERIDRSRLGAGAPLPKDGEQSALTKDRRSNLADEQLRKRLLGKNAKYLTSGMVGNGRSSDKSNVVGHMAPKQRRKGNPTATDSDEDEGRSSLGFSKRRKVQGISQAEGVEGGNADDPAAALPWSKQVNGSPVPNINKSGSYLDEVLAERSKNRARKKRKLKDDVAK